MNFERVCCKCLIHGGISMAMAIGWSPVHAQALGITTQGSSGGLIIPSAKVLPSGTLVVTRGNYSEPNLGAFSKRQNYSLGVGLLPGVELFGRFAEFQNPLPGTDFVSGPRDLSANIKIRLPEFWRGQPDLALGFNDLSGGASFFKSRYGVVGDQWGPLRWSVGYAWGSPSLGTSARGYAFDGVFGGVEWLFGQTGLSLLAEHDGQQKHVGVRYVSAAIPALADAQVVASLHRSLGARDAVGRDMDRTSAAVSLVVPLEKLADKPATFRPEKSLTSLDAKPPIGGMVPTDADRLESLQKSLVASGLERVRVGTQGTSLLVEYENHRYGQSESDAIGLVLGLGAELAPPAIRRVSAITFKAGQRLYETSVDVAIYRLFLRDGELSNARTSLAVDRLPTYSEREIRWLHTQPARRSAVRIEIKPDLNYTVGTEVAAFDYSLAANVQGFVPLWRGAELYTSYIQQLANSENYDSGFAFAAFRQRNGLKVASLQQSLWLGPHIHANLGVGRYNYDSWGIQGEATLFVPGRDDVIRLRGGVYERQPGQSRRQSVPISASYRYVHSPNTWFEAGVQQYSDGSRGPSLVLTRWFGDVGAHLFYRKGGRIQFAGLELSIPLTPRQGMEPGWAQLTGAQQFQRGLRTRLTDGGTSSNNVTPNAVRDLQLDYNAEAQQLNSGRMSQRYFIGQLPRMREAFYLYARHLMAD